MYVGGGVKVCEKSRRLTEGVVHPITGKNRFPRLGKK